MIKRFCDACYKEVKNFHKFEYLMHINSILDGNLSHYVDTEGNAISGRVISNDLCHKCYNKIITEAVKELKNIRNNYDSR